MEWARNFTVPKGGCCKGGDTIYMPTMGGGAAPSSEPQDDFDSAVPAYRPPAYMRHTRPRREADSWLGAPPDIETIQRTPRR